MSDRSCDCFSEDERSFCSNLFEGFFLGVAYFVMAYLINKTTQNRGEIKELFSRLKECEKNHELKK